MDVKQSSSMQAPQSEAEAPPTMDVKKSSSAVQMDKKQKANLKDFTFENLKGETVGKLPGVINGQQFIIQNCKDCNIFIFDHLNMVTVDDCISCNIVIGPTKGSIFIRNCSDCNFMAACQQFRTRDCQNVTTFLCSTTYPIIESSTRMKFGCYCYSYPELEDQFRMASLSVFNNEWSDIRDFTPVEGECNYTVHSRDTKIEDYIPKHAAEELSVMKASYDPLESIVPYTCGMGKKSSKESSLVVFFNDGHSHQRALSYIHDMTKNYPEIRLLRTRELKLNVADVQRVLQTDSYSLVVERGPLIGLEYNGDGSIQACQKTALAIATHTGSTGLLFVASNPKLVSAQIRDFFDVASITSLSE